MNAFLDQQSVSTDARLPHTLTESVSTAASNYCLNMSKYRLHTTFNNQLNSFATPAKTLTI